MESAPDRQASGPIAIVKKIVRGLRLNLYRISSGGKFTWGDNVWVGKGARISCPNYCRFGNNVGTGTDMIVEADLEIGDDVLISSRVSFISDDHRFDDPQTTIFWNGRNPDCKIEIGGDNLIGNGVIVIGPVKIGKGCVVGSGAVVTKDLPPYTICVGTPAKPIKNRFADDVMAEKLKGL